MKKNLTTYAKKQHIKNAGLTCPFCKIDLMDDEEIPFAGGYGNLDPVENGDIEQEMECKNCNRKWIDVFRLVEVREVC